MNEEKQSKGGIPAATPLETLLARDDGSLGATVIGACSATGSLSQRDIQRKFAALGRVVRAAAREEQEAILVVVRRAVAGGERVAHG